LGAATVDVGLRAGEEGVLFLMQVHRYAVEVEGTPEEVWSLFWYRGPRRPTSSGVSIDILHPGDDVGEGLIRHCTFRVPRYLMSGGVGHSWEWLTEVQPPRSWKYDAVGKPLWSKAEGRTELEDLGDGRTRIHFSEVYHAFNPVLRALLERRVHRYISKDNDRLITDAINDGIRRMRAARGTARASATSGDAGAPRTEPGEQGESDSGGDPGG
jgi:hypothetical protein